MSDSFLFFSFFFLFCYSMYLSVFFKLQEKKSSEGGYCWDMGDVGCITRETAIDNFHYGHTGHFS